MEYQEAVQEARRLAHVIEEAEATAEEAKWARAKLSWEQVQTGISQRQWARDIGEDHSTVNRWYQMWERWGGEALHQRPSFYEATEFVRLPGRYGKVEDVKELRHQEGAKAAVRNMPVEQKAEVARELLADEKVADSVMRDTHTRARVSYARERVAEEIEDAARDREQASPVQRELARAGTYFEIGNHQRLARFHAAEAARQLQDLDQRDEGWMRTFRGNNQEIRDAVDWFDVILEGGKVDDASLAKFLEGGAS